VGIHVINPLSDSRWDDLVARHSKASAFHQRGWLEALARTYDYRPFVLTSTPPGEQLADGIVLCGISSWITGARSVSLPFADHCEPLLNDSGEFPPFVNWLRAEGDRQGWRYVELRPRSTVGNADCGLQPGSSYCFHELDISASLEQVFCGLHRNSIQRRIQRAEKEGLSYEAGRSPQLVDEFYRLLLITRRRHHLLPQPLAWFRNLVECMQDGMEISLARKKAVPIGAMLSLRQGSAVIYKYGCSDEKFHHLGAMPFLFWRLIEESKAWGAKKIDLGRSDLDNPGLIVFKDRLGASKRRLTYYRYVNMRARNGGKRWDSRGLRQFFSILPDAAFSFAGRLLYRHMG
jgi:hypothetical protein